MKKITFFLLLLLLSSAIYACDDCGGTVSEAYYRLLPNQYRYQVGVSYVQRNFQSSTSRFGSGNLTHVVNGHYDFKRAELWANFLIAKSFEVEVNIPVAFNQTTVNNRSFESNGLGDCSVKIGYRLMDTDFGKGHHYFKAGVGMKLPTGKYPKDINEDDVTPLNYQPGIGSWGFLGNVNYRYTRQNWLFNIDAKGQINLVNQRGCDFGNSLIGSALAQYDFKFKKDFSMQPSAGVTYEHSFFDKRRGVVQRSSGGYAAYLRAGVSLKWKGYGLYISAFKPVFQDYTERHLSMQSLFDVGVFVVVGR